MSAIAEKVQESNLLAPSRSAEALRDAASLMIPVLNSLQGDEDATFVSKKNRYRQLNISPQLSKLLCQVLNHIEEGGEVIFAPNTRLFAKQEAADILNIPFKHLNTLIEQRHLAVKRVDGIQFVTGSSLYAYKRKRDEESDKVLDELIDLTREFY